MHIPSPQSLGFPEYITAWRPNQVAAVEFIRQSKKRVRAICGPTGFGKTETYVLDGILSKLPTAFVTHSRPLQDQLSSRFSSLGMADLRGRGNYKCIGKDDPDYSCEHGFSASCPFKGQRSCPATNAEMTAATSLMVSTNYDKWIHARKFSTGLNHIKRVVFDEGHEAAFALERAMQITLHYREIEAELGLSFPPYDECGFIDAWRRWAIRARSICDAALKELYRQIHTAGSKVGVHKRYIHLRNLARKLSILATAAVDNWVVEEVRNGWQFDPISAGRYAESALLLKVPEIVVVSATLTKKSLFRMGVGTKDFDFIEFESEFDPKRCPIYYRPVMRVDRRADDLSPMWMALDRFGARRRDRNGIVHTISFSRREEAQIHSRVIREAADHNRLFFNDRGEPATKMVEDFIDAYPGAILATPSVGQGFDFRYHAAEWQFITKLPFPPPSKVMTARKQLDPEYPYHLAAIKLQQICGRLMRDYVDQGETLIVDEHLGWFKRRYGHLFSKSFGQFFREVDVLPSPPERLG